MKCLVVDDSGVTRRILVNTLKTIGFTEIVEAPDGEQALLLCDASVDVVITDWNMPAMSGVEMVRSLRTRPELATLPVLMITARDAPSDVLEAAEAGVNAYLMKPFSPEMLKARIEKLLAPPAPVLLADTAEPAATDDVSGPAQATGTEG